MLAGVAFYGHVAVRCLVKELGANVSQAAADGFPSLYLASQADHLDVVRCLVTELGADPNKAAENGVGAPSLVAAEKIFSTRRGRPGSAQRRTR